MQSRRFAWRWVAVSFDFKKTMNWNLLLIGPRASVSEAVAQHAEFPMATAVAKYITFATDSRPSVFLEARGTDANVEKLRIQFFTPLDAPATPVAQA